MRLSLRLNGDRVRAFHVALAERLKPARHAPLFARYETAAEQQRLRDIDRLEQDIAYLGLMIAAPGGPGQRVTDLQIMRAGISFPWDGVR